MDLQSIRKEIAAEIKQLTKVYKALGEVTTQGKAKRRKMSPESRAKIAAAQIKRWAKARASKGRV